jgi:hypothetical protein
MREVAAQEFGVAWEEFPTGAEFHRRVEELTFVKYEQRAYNEKR